MVLIVGLLKMTQASYDLSASLPKEIPITRGAEIGATGAGTLYGFKKYKEANDIRSPAPSSSSFLWDSATYKKAATKVGEALKRYVETGPELNDEADDKMQSSLQFFKAFETRLKKFKADMLQFELMYAKMDFDYSKIYRKMHKLKNKFTKLMQQIFELRLDIQNSTKLDFFKKAGFLQEYEKLNYKLPKLQMVMIEQEDFMNAVLRGYEEAVVSKDICEILTEPGWFSEMFNYIVKTNKLLDEALQQQYNEIASSYERIKISFEDSKKSWYQKIF